MHGKFFLSKIAIYLSLGLQKGRPSYSRSIQLSKENIQCFKNVKILYFFIFFCQFLPSWIRIRIQQLKLMQIHVDPQPCFNPLILAYCLRCLDTWHRAKAILGAGAAASVSIPGTVPSSVQLPLLITTPVCQPQVQGLVLIRIQTGFDAALSPYIFVNLLRSPGIDPGLLKHLQIRAGSFLCISSLVLY
jgi:hypothetical protein